MWFDDTSAYLAAIVPARLVVLPVLGGAGATIAVALHEWRRRIVLNECLHELRRPLQALALRAHRGGSGNEGGDDGSVEMAAAALARLEREINGGGECRAGSREIVAARPMLEAARRRWDSQARMRGKRIALRWSAEEAAVEGDRIELAAALDNLLANAIEHGGERIELAADRSGERICLAVIDSGSGAERPVPSSGDEELDRVRERDGGQCGRGAWYRGDPLALAALFSGRGERDFRSSPINLSGRARHGHGLRLVRRTAARHGGAFALHKGERGTSAVLELPLASSRWAEPSAVGGLVPREAAGHDPEIVVRRAAR